MIHELRQYKIAEGREADFHQLFRDELIPLFQRHGMSPRDFWEFVPGTDHGGIDLVHHLSFDGLFERRARWAELFEDPDWRALSQRLATAPPWRDVTSLMMRPTSYDP